MTALTDFDRRREEIRASHDDGVDSWEIREADPHPKLDGFVDNYADYWERTGTFTSRRELAATRGVLIFVFGDPLEIVDAEGQALVLGAGEAFIGGAAETTSIARNLGAQRGMHIHAPLSTYARLVGAPAAAIANRCFKLEDMIGMEAAELGERLCEASGSEARYRLVDRFFVRRMAATEAAVERCPVDWAARQLRRADARRPGELAAEIGWSRKHLNRRFIDAFGISPDHFRRLARFERFSAAISAAPHESLAALAADHGYVDQAHLTRETRQFSAMTPGELRRRLHPGGGGVTHD
ncbi:MAG: helix-turn-helix domain-containing protein [Parasphingopyxis sp.]|uniref:AraC family transcriptional regulator n=1 Tax=Parasphingopyxis sp. TaxID=1920299 RepID=UPI003FA03E19